MLADVCRERRNGRGGLSKMLQGLAEHLRLTHFHKHNMKDMILGICFAKSTNIMGEGPCVFLS